MKKEINNVLILMTLGGLIFNGCASRSIVIVDDNYKKNNKTVKVQPFSWNKIKTKSPLVQNKKEPVVQNGFRNKLSSDFNNPIMGSTAFGNVGIYAENFEGKRTASGDVFNRSQKTASHKSLPFNTMLKVTNLKNNKSEVVRVNDRGGFLNGAILNVSSSVAQSLNLNNNETSNVKIEILGFDGIVVNELHSTESKQVKPCDTCYVSVPTRNSRIVSVNKKKKVAIQTPVETTYKYDENPNENLYGSAEVMNVSPIIENFSEKTAIQIGAFREYAGAKVYAKKYDLLSSQYNVEIKENVKDEHPLFRVRIEGFPNEFEAKEFIERYGLTGAFLVRK